MKSAAEHSELPVQQNAEYESRSPSEDVNSNLDDFEELLAAAERVSKAAARAGCEAQGVPSPETILEPHIAAR
jgi:hypothetical protein